MILLKQILLINKDAVLLHSCDSLFVTENLRNQNIIPYFPFLESVFDDLINRLKVDGRIVFTGVETKHAFLPGYYDYIFNLMYQNKKEVIEWQILDTTTAYNDLRVQQQNHHNNKAFPNRNASNSQ
ncbi:MAG: hypothetical protein AB8G86_27455 [Saprospiraceae bacterium]